MAKYETTIIGRFDEVINNLNNDINSSGLTVNLVDESNYNIGETKVAVRVYDKYFMRNESRASLSLTVVGNENEIFISAIGAGGGKGIIFNWSLGAETEMVDVVKMSVERMK